MKDEGWPSHDWDHRRMAPAERADYERELLRSLRENMDFEPSEYGRYVLSVDLHGTYPKTICTVRYCQAETQQILCWDFDVWPWRDDPDEIGAHSMGSPDEDASVLVLNWEEGIRDPRPCA